METFTPDYWLRLIVTAGALGLSIQGASFVADRVLGTGFSQRERIISSSIAIAFLSGFQMARDYRHAAIVITVVVTGTLAWKWLDSRRNLDGDETSGE